MTRLAPALQRLRREGAPFSLTISTPDGIYVEVDGRTAGARAVVWILDASVRGVEEGGAGGRIDGATEVIARDPAAFLEMWNEAPFMAWRVDGGLKLQWANPNYLSALEAKSLSQAVDRNLQLDQGATDLARKAIETGEAVEETRSAVVGGQLRTLRLRVSPVAGGAAGLAIDVTESEAASEQMTRQQRAHDETLNHLAEGIAVFDQSKRLVFHNRAFEQMWALDPAFLQDRPSHAAWLDYLKEKRKLPAHANYAEWRARELALYQEHEDLPEDFWVLPDSRMLRVARQPHPSGGMLMIFSDITNEVSLKSSYDALLQTQKAALDKLHEAVVVFGLDGRLKLHNAAFGAMWKLEAGAVENEMAFDKVVGRDRAEGGRVQIPVDGAIAVRVGAGAQRAATLVGEAGHGIVEARDDGEEGAGAFAVDDGTAPAGGDEADPALELRRFRHRGEVEQMPAVGGAIGAVQPPVRSVPPTRARPPPLRLLTS